MYRIKAINTQTGIIFYEYGFAGRMMKVLHHMFNEKDGNFYCIYEIMDISKLVLTFSTFWKCLTGHTEVKGERLL